MTQTNAALELKFDVQNNQTIMRVCKQEPPLRVIRAFPIASSQDCVQPVLVHLHNVSGGLLGGDQLHLDATIAPQARVQLTSTGSTRVYRRRAGHLPTTQTTHLVVEAGGLLEYLPDSLIPYAQSQYHQSVRIELAEGAGLFYWEIITPGREAKGEFFEYKDLRFELDIVAKGVPIAIERSRLEPARYLPIQPDAAAITADPATGFGSLARLGPYRYFATFYICRVGVAKSVWLDLEKRLDKEARTISQPGASLWGVSTLSAHGLSVRAVGTSSYAIQEALPRFWQLAKEQLYQQNAVMPRKVY